MKVGEIWEEIKSPHCLIEITKKRDLPSLTPEGRARILEGWEFKYIKCNIEKDHGHWVSPLSYGSIYKIFRKVYE